MVNMGGYNQMQGMMPSPGMGGMAGMGELVNTLNARVVDLEQQLSGLGRLKVAEDVTEDWLQIPFRFVAVASGSTMVVTRTIAGDGPFDLIEITHRAVSSGNTENSDFRIRIKEGESVGRTLTIDGEFIDASNTSGTAQRPYIIKGRRRFRANIAIVAEVTNTFVNGQETNTIELVLHGIKVFTR